MFVITHENQVVLGPMKWNRFRFENFLNEEHEISTTLDTANQDQVVVVNDQCKIMPVQTSQDPAFNPRIEFLNGPFWEFNDTAAVSSYRVEPLNIDSAKNTLKAQANQERTAKEAAGVKFTVDGVEHTFASDKETRNAMQSLIVANVANVNWKANSDTWLALTHLQLKEVYAAVQAHVQATFDWEKNKVEEISAAAVPADLLNIVIVEQTQVLEG